MIQKSNRKVIECAKCKAFKDLDKGRLLINLKSKSGLVSCQFFKTWVWLCYECLPANEEEDARRMMEGA